MKKTEGLYFKQEEFLETIRNGQKLDLNKPRVNLRIQYKCSPGAFYEGQMRGGFRDGQGTMNWPDGAFYKGEWEMGYACGHGSFNHVDGDVYVGHWMNNKCNGKGQFKNKQGASFEGDWVDDI